MCPARPAPNSPAGPGQVNAPATGKTCVEPVAGAGVAGAAGGGRRLFFLRFGGLFGVAGARTTDGLPAPAPPLAAGAATPPLSAAKAAAGTSRASTSTMNRARVMLFGSAAGRTARDLQRIAQTPITRFSSSAAPFLLS